MAVVPAGEPPPSPGLRTRLLYDCAGHIGPFETPTGAGIGEHHRRDVTFLVVDTDHLAWLTGTAVVPNVSSAGRRLRRAQ
jgi:hypothetical protein